MSDIILAEGSAPNTPNAGQLDLYAGVDQRLHQINSAGVNKKYAFTTEAWLKNSKIISVAVDGSGDFTSIAAACASITDASVTNTYVVQVGPGTFTEPLITVPSYVFVMGATIYGTTVQPDTANHNIFDLINPNVEVSFLTVQNAGTGYAAFNCKNCGNYTQLHKVSIYDCDIGVDFAATTADSYVYVEYVDFNGAYTNAIKTVSADGYVAQINSENIYFYPTSASVQLLVEGSTSLLHMQLGGMEGVGSDIGVQLSYGAQARIHSFYFLNSSTAIFVDSTGTNPNLLADSLNFVNCNLNLNIENATAIGNFVGFSEINKTIINPVSAFFIIGTDPHILTVRKKDGNFSSIAAACAYITGSSPTNTFIIDVGAGEFIEPEINIPPYTSIRGSTINGTIVKPDSGDHNIFNMPIKTELSFLSIQDAGLGYCAVSCLDCGNFAQLHKVSIYNCDIGIYLASYLEDSNLYVEYVDINGTYSYAIWLVSQNGYIANLGCENFYTFPEDGCINQIKVDGTKAELEIICGIINGIGTEVGVLVTNGGSADLYSSCYRNFALAVHLDTIGTTPSLRMSSVDFEGNTQNFNIENSTATGFFTGYTEFSKYYINPSSSFFVNDKNLNMVRVAHKGGDFTDISSALSAITTANFNNQYVIQVDAGDFYISSSIIMKPYVHVKGSGKYETNIIVSVNTISIITACKDSSISNVCLKGATGSGGKAITYSGDAVSDDFFKIESCRFYDCETLVYIRDTVGKAYFYLNDCHVYGTYTTGVDVSASTNHTEAYFLHFLVFSNINPVTFYKITGTTAIVGTSLTSCIPTGTPLAGSAIEISNGAFFKASNCEFGGFANAVNALNYGVGSTLQINSTLLSNFTNYDVLISHPSTSGFFNGSADHTKVSVNNSASFHMNYSNAVAGIVILKDILQGDSSDKLLNISEMIREISPIGLVYGGLLIQNTGLSVTVSSGWGYLLVPDASVLGFYTTKATWDTTTLNLNNSQEQWVYVDNTFSVKVSNSKPDSEQNINIVHAYTEGAVISYIEYIPRIALHTSNKLSDTFRNALGPIYQSGSLVTENGTRKLNITSGTYYYGALQITPSAGTAFTWREYHRASGGGWNSSLQSTIDNAYYDDGSGTLASITPSGFSKASLYTAGEGTNTSYLLVYPQAVHASLSAAETGANPSAPSFFDEAVTQVSSIIVQQGATHLSEIIDIRPKIGFSAQAVAGTSDHRNLSYLTTGDSGHTQFLMTDGSKAMTAPLNMGTQNISNAGTINLVTITAHEARHLPTGSDPLATAAPTTNLTSITLNAVGSANSLSKSDHSHAITVGVVSGQAPDQTSASGVSASLSRSDHIHNIPTAAGVTLDSTSTNTQGNAVTFARSNHTHAITSAAPISQTPDQINAVGSSAGFSKADHVHNIVTAAPLANLTSTTTNAQGSASGFSRSDHSHAISTGVVSTQTSDQTNAAGNSVNLAKADHVHNIPTSTPNSLLVGGINAQGSASGFSKSDHTHGIAVGTPVNVGAANSNGSVNTFVYSDHVHAGMVSLTGDVTANGVGSVAATVARIRGVLVSATAPTNGQALIYNSSTSNWEPSALTASSTEASSNTLASTNSNSYVSLISLGTLAAGTYFISFTGDFYVSNSNREVEITLYSAGAQVTKFLRNMYFSVSSQEYCGATSGILTLVSSSTVEIRWLVTGGNTVYSENRTVTALKIG